jgi:hypothetical protein
MLLANQNHGSVSHVQSANLSGTEQHDANVMRIASTNVCGYRKRPFGPETCPRPVAVPRLTTSRDVDARLPDGMAWPMRSTRPTPGTSSPTTGDLPAAVWASIVINRAMRR